MYGVVCLKSYPQCFIKVSLTISRKRHGGPTIGGLNNKGNPGSGADIPARTGSPVVLTPGAPSLAGLRAPPQ